MKVVLERKEGFGAVLQGYVYSLLYGEENQETIYIPRHLNLEHNYSNETDFNAQLNTYMNLSQHYGIPLNLDATMIPTFMVDYSKVEPHLDRLTKTPFFEQLKERFLENKTNPYDSDHFHVAVHIRRLNPHDNRLWGTDTPDDEYIEILKKIRQEYTSAKPLLFHIFSQSYCFNKNLYDAPDIVLHLDETIQQTVNGFLFPDIFVTSTSSFSYIVAFFSKAKIYYKKFWHAPLSHWLVV
jgi:hypothetical protein